MTLCIGPIDKDHLYSSFQKNMQRIDVDPMMESMGVTGRQEEVHLEV